MCYIKVNKALDFKLMISLRNSMLIVDNIISISHKSIFIKLTRQTPYEVFIVVFVTFINRCVIHAGAGLFITLQMIKICIKATRRTSATFDIVASVSNEVNITASPDYTDRSE